MLESQCAVFEGQRAHPKSGVTLRDRLERATRQPGEGATATASVVHWRMTKIPAHLEYLLDQPIYAVLGTIRPDDTVQVNPMWFERVGDEIHFTHTTKRGKFRNLQHNPSMSLAIIDPADPLVYIELRGALRAVIEDPSGAFYVRLGTRYGNAAQQPPADSADRVILVMSIDKALGH